MNERDLKSLIEKHRDLQSQVDQTAHGRGYRNNGRTILGVPLLRHSLSIAYSISVLLEGKYLGAAFTLFRPLFESYARAIWILHCADEKDLQKAQNDQFPTLSKVVEYISSQSNLRCRKWFQSTYNTNKISLNSLTHGGMQMIQLLYDDDTVKVDPDDPLNEQINLMEFAHDVTIGSMDELFEHLRLPRSMLVQLVKDTSD